MEETIRWTEEVSPGTSHCARSWVSTERKKGDLSKFNERVVQKEILTRTAADVKQRNADLADNQLQALINEAAAARTELRAEMRGKVKPR